MSSRSPDKVAQDLDRVFGRSLTIGVSKSVADSKQFNWGLASSAFTKLTKQAAMTRSEPSMAHTSPVKKSKKRTDIDNAIEKVRKGYKVMIILRGMPGSGKSTLARHILDSSIPAQYRSTANHILSADDFFMKNGTYNYNAKQVPEAHGWNHNRAFKVMSQGYSPVIIDNTNTQMWEMKPYAMMATDFGYYLEILEPDTHWCFNERELAKRNKHDVPKTSIRNMIERYEKNVTPMKLLTAYDCKYKLQIPPQMRLHPPVNDTVTPGQAQPDSFIDFTDLAMSRIKKSRPVSEAKPSSSVDNMLMHQDDWTFSENILKPQKPNGVKLSASLLDNWGIDENSLHSWGIVTPIKENQYDNIEILPLVVIDANEDLITCDASTNTDEDDLDYRAGVKILQTYSRDINRNFIPRATPPSKKLMLEKGCITEDLTDDYRYHLQQITTVFPHVPLKNIEYWYKKCNHDVEVTIEFLLSEDDKLSVPIENETDTPIEIVDSDDTESSNSNNSVESEPPRKISKNKRNKQNPEKLQLKKCIENMVTISDTHYSDNILKIKQSRYGVSKKHTDAIASTNNAVPVESDSPEQLDYDEEPFEIIDMDAYDVSGRTDCETVELNLGEFVVNQLEEKFGDPKLVYPKGFQTSVQIPVSLAKQLYTFYIESVYQQMEAQDAILKKLELEDEQFARKLQRAEEEEAARDATGTSSPPVPGIPDIMREEKQKNKWQKDVEKWKDLNPDTLAAKLTRQKLFDAFPTVNQDVLVEMLYAHDNIYKDTVEMLLNNTNPDDVHGDLDTVRDPPLNSAVLSEMKEDLHDCNELQCEDEICSGLDYREEARKYLWKRSDLYEKAQRYYQSGMREIAQFYSGLATKYTDYYDRANSRAATAFVEEHSQRLQDFNTLDLHFLYVKEAIPSLDVFLDRNINLLRLSPAKKKENLQIITGRGRNSWQGRARLRPAVQYRLKERHLEVELLNPGMLEVKITKNSKLSSEL